MKTPPLSMYRRIATAFVVITVVLVFLIFYYSLTYAYITITPKVSSVEYPFTIVVTQDQQQEDYQKGVFQGTFINQEIEVTDTFQATGIKQVTSDISGSAVIINNYSRPQPLVATTRLLTEGDVLFRINETVTVPVGGRTPVTFYQDDPTISTALEVGERLTIPGLFIDLQDFIYAEVTEVVGGTPVDRSYVTKEDLDQSVGTLVEQVKDQIEASLDDGDMAIMDVEVIQKDFSVLVGEEVDSFIATIRAEVSGVVVPKQRVQEYAMLLLQGSISNDVALHRAKDASLQLAVSAYDVERDLIQLSGVIASDVIVRKNSQALQRNKLVNLSKDEAVSYLRNLEEVEDAKVEFFPFWVKKIPSFEDHITITITE